MQKRSWSAPIRRAVEVALKTTAGSSRSRLQEKLLERLQEIRAKGDELWRGFSGAWAQTFGAPRFDDAEALFGDCLRQPPRELLEGVLWFARELRELVAHDVGKRSLVGETAIAIGLLACERHILNQCPQLADGAPVTGMLIDADDRLAAAVIAAVWSRMGIRLVVDKQTAAPRVDNLLPHDVEPLEFLWSDDRDRAFAEVQAMVDAARLRELDSYHGNERARGRRVRLEQVRSRGIPAQEALQIGLRRVEEHLGARPIFGIQHADPHPMHDANLRREFAVELGVHTFLFDAAAKESLSESEAGAWQKARLQPDVLNCIGPLFEALYPEEVKSMKALQDMHFRVALSFPGEHRPYVKAISDELKKGLGPEELFYDDDFKAHLARPSAHLPLMKVYGDQSDLLVVFLCAEYQQKKWCGLEWRVVYELIMRRQEERIMLFRFDDTRIDGLLLMDIAIDCGTDRLPPAEAAGLILKRLHATPPKP